MHDLNHEWHYVAFGVFLHGEADAVGVVLDILLVNQSAAECFADLDR